MGAKMPGAHVWYARGLGGAFLMMPPSPNHLQERGSTMKASFRNLPSKSRPPACGRNPSLSAQPKKASAVMYVSSWPLGIATPLGASAG